MRDFNIFVFEEDCEQAYHRLVQVKKAELRAGEFGAHLGWKDIERYLRECYTLNYRGAWNDQLNILAKWKNKAYAELDCYDEELKARKQEDEDRRQRQEEDDRRREKARRAEQERERAEAQARAEALAAQREAERQREIQENWANSLRLLMAAPYNLNKEDAEDFIDSNGEIDDKALTKYENCRKNKELLAQKAAQWNARKKAKSAESSLKCRACGGNVIAQDKFCRKCGAALQKECPICKRILTVSNKFCTGCGTKL